MRAVLCADAEAKQSKGTAQNSLLSAVALCDHAGEVIYVGQNTGNHCLLLTQTLCDFLMSLR